MIFNLRAKTTTQRHWKHAVDRLLYPTVQLDVKQQSWEKPLPFPGPISGKIWSEHTKSPNILMMLIPHAGDKADFQEA